MRSFKSLFVAIVALGAIQAHAASVYWTNTTSSANWNDAGVWTATPGGGDTPTFTNQNTYTVNFPTGSGVVTTNFGALFDAGSLSASVFLNIGAGNTWLVTNGNFRISGNVAAGSNNVNNVILTSGTLINTNPVNNFAIGSFGKGALTVSNGATAIIGKALVGINAGSVGTLTVAGGVVSNVNVALGIGHSGTGAAWVLGGTLYSSAVINVGSQTSSSGSMTVSNGTVNASAGMSVGGGAAATAGAVGTLTVAGGLVQITGTLQVGRASSTGTVFVTNGGVLEANTYSLGAHTANVVTNDGGVYQFTSATPTLTVTGSGGISLNNGVISFRDVSSFNLTNNTGSTGLGAVSYSGNNTLRLTGTTTATNTVAAGYTFDSFANTGNAKTYKGLELINGTTALTGRGITIGSGGSFLASNTTATIRGTFTNYSVSAQVVNSTVDFVGGIYSTGKLTLVNNSYVQGAGVKTIATGGRLEGNGTIVGDMTVAGVVAPGFNQGSLIFSNNLTLSGTAEMELLSGGNLGTSDKFNVFGALTGSGVVKATTNGVFTLAGGDKWDLFDWTSGIPSFTFDGSAITLDPGLSWDTSQLNVDGTVAIVAVPEPSTLTLVGIGLLSAVVLRRRHLQE